MAKIDTHLTFKRLRNRYRLVVMNDDTYEEVVVFRLGRRTVYVALSVIFVVLVGLTIALVSFTNLKYMIPGYGKQSSLKELRVLKLKTDSLEQVMNQKQHYLDALKRVLNGDTNAMVTDTSLLKLPTDSISPD